jgi:hypothetical protein
MTAMYGKGWSGWHQLFWRDKVSEVLELPIAVTQAGTYHVIVRCTKGHHYGIAQFALDGTAVKGPVDFYAEKIAPADPINLTPRTLTAGQHILKIEIVGKNPATAATYFGLDYVKLSPAL